MHTENQLKIAIKQATAQHFWDPVEYARSKRDEAGKRKNWHNYGLWQEVISYLIDQEADPYSPADYSEHSDADNGL